MNLLLILAAILSQPVETITGLREMSAPWTVPRIDIEGRGPNGTDPTGPVIRFGHGVENGFVLGAGDPFRATGTRFDRLRIARLGTGGTAIKIVAKSAAERPGEIVINDVLVCGWSDLRGATTKDNWDTALLIDGGNEPELTKSGVAGIRRVRIDRFRAASCLGDSIVFRNVTHLVGTDIQIDQGTATEMVMLFGSPLIRPRVPVMVIENSRHVFLAGINIFGELHLRNCNNVVVSGYVQTLRIDKACKDIVVVGLVGKAAIEAKAARVNISGMGVVK